MMIISFRELVHHRIYIRTELGWDHAGLSSIRMSPRISVLSWQMMTRDSQSSPRYSRIHSIFSCVQYSDVLMGDVQMYKHNPPAALAISRTAVSAPSICVREQG